MLREQDGVTGTRGGEVVEREGVTERREGGREGWKRSEKKLENVEAQTDFPLWCYPSSLCALFFVLFRPESV